MLTFRELQAVARRLRRSGLQTVEIKGADYAVKITCAPGMMPQAPLQTVADAVAPPVAEPLVQTVTASMPGHIWLEEPLTGKALAAEQAAVQAGDLLALLQVGAVCLPLRAAHSGRLNSWSVTQGERVEYGQPVAHILTEEITREDH